MTCVVRTTHSLSSPNEGKAKASERQNTPTFSMGDYVMAR